ncbi:HAD family hydrolase [Kribbella sp. NPDC050241]|uniref:HAD family hydrolase n=1 Tax=Kribbella sp. NPDC050241 TaxID=3364115 RepID=UPI00378A199B
MTGTYLRVQARYRGRLGVEVGLFVAVDHLRRAGRLTDEQVALYLDIDDWFLEYLPEPGFYADGNTAGAVTWFKTPLPAEMQTRVDRLCAVLAAHDVPFDVVHSDRPGEVIYEDAYQIGVIPAERGEPTPLPEGLVLAPTSAGSKRGVAASPIRHVLFDADGVLQDLPGGWYAAMEPYLGERTREFLHRTWKDELPMLAGRGDYMPLLAATLAEYGVETRVDVVYQDVWHRIDRIEESFAIVEQLRRHGYGVHLGTNQERYRGGHMRTTLGYDDIFDVSCYSYDLGAAKPDPAFFTEAAHRIASDPSTILFIDDNPDNVASARSVGFPAELWDFTQGHTTLITLLANHGIEVTPAYQR